MQCAGGEAVGGRVASRPIYTNSLLSALRMAVSAEAAPMSGLVQMRMSLIKMVAATHRPDRIAYADGRTGWTDRMPEESLSRVAGRQQIAAQAFESDRPNDRSLIAELKTWLANLPTSW